MILNLIDHYLFKNTRLKGIIQLFPAVHNYSLTHKYLFMTAHNYDLVIGNALEIHIIGKLNLLNWISYVFPITQSTRFMA